jgi:hypothetical protein
LQLVEIREFLKELFFAFSPMHLNLKYNYMYWRESEEELL